jgi:hypothetical protein
MSDVQAILGIRPKLAGAETCGVSDEPHDPCCCDTSGQHTLAFTMNGVTHTLKGRLSHDGKTWTFSNATTPRGTCTISAM